MTAPIWSDGFFPANNISIHYYQSLPASSLTLAALPVLIYLHGLVMSGGTLIEAATNFTNDFEVILPDARGHGRSSPIPKGSFLMPYLVADAISVIEKFSRGLPVFLIGHSMGAATAARVAKLRPDLVRALILEEPPWSRFLGAPPNVTNSLLVSSTLGEPTRDLRNMSDGDFFTFDTAGQGLMDFAMSASQAQRAWDVDDCEETLLELDLDVVEAVGGIKVPLELQMGDIAADCPSFFASALRPHIANEILLTYKSANFYFFENGSHLLHIDPTVGVWTKEVLRYFKSYTFNVVL